MQPARRAVAPGVPAYLVTRPTPGSRDVDRTGLRSRITRALEDHRICALLAPAGYGKTSVLTAWARQTRLPVEWLSLTRADHDAEHLARHLAAALAHLDTARAAGGQASAVLILDDIHLAGDAAAREVLARFVEHAPDGVRLVLSGRTDPGLGLARLLAAGDLIALEDEDLSFTGEEVRQVALALGHGLTSEQAAALQSMTRGWPVAVRLAIMSSAAAPRAIQPAPTTQIPRLPEYLVESVLAALPTPLADFVVEACTCEWLSAGLADEVLGRRDAAAMLEEVVTSGLPLERRESPGAEPIYRWHPLMAASGRALLARRDPTRLRELQQRTARALASLDPIQAATHAFEGGDHELASALLRSQWLAALLRGDSGLVEELCEQLPAPFSEAPEILAIRAACLRNAGEAERAADLDARARALSPSHPEPRIIDLTISLARLFVLDRSTELAVESERANAILVELTSVSGTLRGCALLLIGWTELRLRRPGLAVPRLREAGILCRAEGLTDLADRARANESFALAFAGNFEDAIECMASVSTDAAFAGWRRDDGAIEWYTLGWIRYWTGEPEAAMDAFEQAASRGGGLISYADLARCWLVDAAVDARSPALAALADTHLDKVPAQTIQGLPFDVYKAVAQAGVAVVAGNRDLALRQLDAAITFDLHLPAANLLAAELYWRCGAFEKAVAVSRLLASAPPYLRAGAVVLEALEGWSAGKPDLAHLRLETALELSAPQRLLRPFLLPVPELHSLLLDHAAWGTRHEELVAEALSRRAKHAPERERQSLTEREREILGHLSTTRSISEIAAALHISPNTLKTHLKSIYRKLGVESRRQAISVSATQVADEVRRGAWIS